MSVSGLHLPISPHLFFSLSLSDPRSITRITLHPSTRQVGLRTALPSPLNFLPFAKQRSESSGLRHELSTINGLSTGQRDSKTRVVSLDSIFRQFGQSSAQAYPAANLSDEASRLIGFTLSSVPGLMSPAGGDKRKMVRSPRTTDMLYLDVKPYKLLFGVRAAGGKQVVDVEAATATVAAAPGTKPAAPVVGEAAKMKKRSLYSVGWDQFRNALLQPTDWDDVTPAEAEATRKLGDPFLRAKCLEAARRKGYKSPSPILDAVIGDGLGIREPWFKDRANFDQLFPVVGSEQAAGK